LISEIPKNWHSFGKTWTAEASERAKDMENCALSGQITLVYAFVSVL
jgi:hypothetical protein